MKEVNNKKIDFQKRQFECFLWSYTKQKMYRESFLKIELSKTDTSQ